MPVFFFQAEKGAPTIPPKSKSESKDKDRKHKKHKDRDKDKDREHKKHKHKHRSKDKDKDKDRDRKKDKNGHHESGDHSKKHHDKVRHVCLLQVSVFPKKNSLCNFLYSLLWIWTSATLLFVFSNLWNSHGAVSLISQKRKHDGDEDLNDVQRHKKNKVMVM